MRVDMHSGRIEPAEERLSGLLVLIDEIHRGAQELPVDRLHAPFVERSSVLNFLLAYPAKARVFGRVIRVARDASKHAARTEFGAELRVFRVVGVFRLLFGIEVIEIAEEFIKSVHGRQEFIAVAKMILAELTGSVAVRLEQLS